MGARIDESLDLASARVQFPLRTFKCAFTQDLVLDRSILRSLQLQGTYLKNLTGDGLSVERDILIQDGSRVEGRLWLKEATIGGSLDCAASQVLNPGSMALNLNAAKLGADVVLGNGFKADGAVELVGTTVGGVITCDGGQFNLPGKIALNLENVKADAILLRRPDSSGDIPFMAHGQVWIYGASINGGVECDGGQFIETTIDALVVENTTVKGAMFLREGFSATGQVKLRHSNIKGDLDFSGGTFDPGENAQYAIDGNEIEVKGTVFFNGNFIARGPVWFNSANIDGSLLCGQGHFLNPRGTALTVVLAKIGGSVLLDDGFEADGKVSFVDSRID